MAETVQQLQAKLDAIQKARDAGVLMTRHGDTSLQFRSLDEMDRIISSLKQRIDAASGQRKSRINYITQTGKGY